jgi:hypothetical protein
LAAWRLVASNISGSALGAACDLTRRRSEWVPYRRPFGQKTAARGSFKNSE